MVSGHSMTTTSIIEIKKIIVHLHLHQQNWDSSSSSLICKKVVGQNVNVYCRWMAAIFGI